MSRVVTTAKFLHGHVGVCKCGKRFAIGTFLYKGNEESGRAMHDRPHCEDFKRLPAGEYLIWLQGHSLYFENVRDARTQQEKSA